MRSVLRGLTIVALTIVLAPSVTWPLSQPETKDFTGRVLNNKDFGGENLNKAIFDRAQLKYSKFRDATLKNASFVGADLRGANFRKANLENADFTDAKLEGAFFTDAKAWRANFSGCEIHLARAKPLDLGHSKLNLDPLAIEIIRSADDATSGGLSFRYADLHDALILGNASGVDFRDADLRGADLGHAENVDEALLKGAKYDHETRWTIDPKNAGAIFKESDNPPQPKHPLCGKWLILKGVEGAPDHGVLRIWRDHTFEWDLALSDEKPRFVVGYWTAVGDKTVTDKMELHIVVTDEVWTAEKSEYKGMPEITLKNKKGVKRVGVID